MPRLKLRWKRRSEVDGFLGSGEKDVAVPFKAVQFKAKDNNKWYAVMNATKDALKNAPSFGLSCAVGS
jgi:hypothetical protein